MTITPEQLKEWQALAAGCANPSEGWAHKVHLLVCEVRRLTANNRALAEVADHNHRECQKVEAQVEALRSGWPEGHRSMCPGPAYCDCIPQEQRDARDAQIAAALEVRISKTERTQ